MPLRYWLLKSEPETYSIDDLARDRRTAWEGVRNYQARNFIRDRMRPGDLVLFYHSSADPPVVAGLARVASPPRPDPSAWDRKSPSYDPKASAENPIWQLFDVEFVEKFAAPVALADLRRQKRLRGLALLERGQRLSVLPVSAAHFAAIRALAKGRS